MIEKSSLRGSLEDFILLQKDSDPIMMDDIKREKTIIDISDYKRNNTYNKENIMGICCIKNRKVFHLSSQPEEFSASLIWIINNIFNGKMDTNTVKVVLGEDMSLSKRISTFMDLKCEKGYLVAYPLGKDDYQNTNQIKKSKAFFTMDRSKKYLERGEWIDVIRL